DGGVVEGRGQRLAVAQVDRHQAGGAGEVHNVAGRRVATVEDGRGVRQRPGQVEQVVAGVAFEFQVLDSRLVDRQERVERDRGHRVHREGVAVRRAVDHQGVGAAGAVDRDGRGGSQVLVGDAEQVVDPQETAVGGRARRGLDGVAGGGGDEREQVVV